MNEIQTWLSGFRLIMSSGKELIYLSIWSHREETNCKAYQLCSRCQGNNSTILLCVIWLTFVSVLKSLSPLLPSVWWQSCSTQASQTLCTVQPGKNSTLLYCDIDSRNFIKQSYLSIYCKCSSLGKWLIWTYIDFLPYIILKLTGYKLKYVTFLHASH